MAIAQKESAAAEGMYIGAYKSGMPTLQSERAKPPQASKTTPSTQPAHQQQRSESSPDLPVSLSSKRSTGEAAALRGSQRRHPTGLPATSKNASSDRSAHEALAASWQDCFQKLQLFTPTSLPPDIPDVDSVATSSPQGNYKYQLSDFSPLLLETHISHFMSLQPPETMQTPPVSAHPSPNNTAMDDQPSRKRSHSVMSNEQEFEQQMIAAATATASTNDASLPNGHRQDTRSLSVTSGGVETEGYSGRGSRAFKRGDPPQNEHGKYVCDYNKDCRDFTFDRKCEWSKHMDKHDRPYRCPHQSCGKLQGFTYSGGLLRHEREVHGKHGGPKAQLMCPHSDCKRHAGKGFTRKENLNEHLRRVHFSRNPESQDVGLGAGDDEAEVDSATQEAIAALGDSTSSKRKRSLHDDTENPSDIILLRQELAMLRAENERKDAVVQDLTQQLARDQQGHESNMRESIATYQQN